MARYVVHVKGEDPEALAGARFVRDGFSWLASTFGPFWFFAKGAWMSACLALALLAGFVAVATALRLPVELSALGIALINLLLALEAGALRSWELRLRGYRDVALVAGHDLDALEQRFFSEAAKVGPETSGPAVPLRMSGAVPVIGLFPNPPRGGHS